MKLKQYAQKLGISYGTALNWFHARKIPDAYQIDTGTIIVPDLPGSGTTVSERTKTVIYARVSSNEQRKTNLETQAERVSNFASANGWIIDKVVKEVGSGLNDKRTKLIAVLEDPTVKRIVVEHKDRLTRFGFNYLETMAKLQGFEIIVINKTLDHDTDDLMADFTAIITSFCARLYSRRRGKCKAKELTKHLDSD